MFAESALDLRLSAKAKFPFIQADRRVSGPAFPALPSFRIQIVPPLEPEHEESHLFREIRPSFEGKRRFRVLIGSAFREQHPLIDHDFQITLQRPAVYVRT